jgi:hypothetical protein
MKLYAVILPAFIALSASAHAAEGTIYKCAGVEGVVYRDTPCASMQQQTVPAAAQKINVQAEHARPAYPDPKPDAPIFASKLFIGMTDTQVLNLPSVGRPARIVRTKTGRQWREQWIYSDRNTGDERRVLYFENARLVDHEELAGRSLVQVRALIQ